MAIRGGEEALRHFRHAVHVDNKLENGGFDPVTEGDRAAERVMRSMIEAEYPEHQILGEEYGTKKTDAPWRWVLDPIDGTRGYVAGSPTWMTLVGLEYDGDPVVGAMVQPFTREVWHGYPKQTVYYRDLGENIGEVCSASEVVQCGVARLLTTDPRSVPDGYFTPAEAESFAALSRACRVTRFSLDAYAYALVASGCADVVAETGLQRYDVSAIIPVIRGAGAVISSWDGGFPGDGGRVLAAASAQLHEEALGFVQ
ncbi:MAG: hypothetical protein KTR25_06660 [Myxococcales bacterium]|nr:hypothetical protein [Myxococcales bacterium]